VIYDLCHVTTYGFEAPVSSARCILRLTPAETPEQQLLSHRIEIDPAPVRRREHKSHFGVATIDATIESRHRELRITARSRVAVRRAPPALPDNGPPWEEVREEAARSSSLLPSSPIHHLFPSRLIRLAEPLTLYAASCFPPDRRVLDGAIALMQRVRAEFTYDPRATLVSTPLMQAFEHRRGVCQDFAHIMIAGLRGLGLPASYVSGYIRTVPPPGSPRRQGVDATHAWVALWCGPEGGWVGLDPTNAVVVADEHVILAVGRDYADVSPIDGVILGSGAQRLSVAVDVVPVGEPG
jgi:transglutaminase-like putative cysteine protease